MCLLLTLARFSIPRMSVVTIAIVTVVVACISGGGVGGVATTRS